MKRIIRILLLTFINVNATCAFSQEVSKNRIEPLWQKLVPTHLKLQYAGSMGNFSMGPGWNYGKHQQWDTDLYIGYLSRHGNVPVHITMTLKQTYIPFNYSIIDECSVQLLTAGFYINKVFGEYFWNKLPERYPKGYYFWMVNTRFHVFMGQAATFRVSHHKEKYLLGAFYEFNTNDLYVISAIGNDYVKWYDIIGLSFGLKFSF